MSDIKMTLTDGQKDRIEDLYSHLDTEYQVRAVAYMYGLDRNEAKERLQELPEDKIADSVDYYDLDGLPVKMKQEMFERKQAARQEIQERYGLSPLRAMCARDDTALGKGLESLQAKPDVEKGQ